MQLVAENLVVTRGERLVIDGLSFTAGAGEALVLTGPNGAGKTTLLRTIAGFIRPEAGSVRLVRREAPSPGSDEDEPTLAEQAHVVGHRDGLKSALTVEENAAFWAQYLATERGPGDGGSARPPRESAVHRRIAGALDRFGLRHLAPIRAGYLSAGQRRRVGLTRLLLARRPLWLLDEPTASLDTASQKVLADCVNEHLAAGGLVVAATHLPLGFDKARELALSPVAVAA